MRLAEKGFEVIAAVEIWAQVQTLKRQAAGRGVCLQVEKLDKFYLPSGLRAGAYTYRGIAVHERPGELRIRETPLR